MPLTEYKIRIETILNTIVNIFKFIFISIFMSFILWLILCSLDYNPPINMTNFKALNIESGNLEVEYVFSRNRQCYYKGTKIAVDKNGKTLFSETSERMVNGELGHVNKIEDYPIDKNAAAGIGTFTLYATWQCPYNIMHKLNPITATYMSSFNIKKE